MGATIVYFTAGTVGAGHAVRGEAIRRGLVRAGHDGELRILAPSGGLAPMSSDAWEPVDVQGDPRLADPERAPTSGLGERLRALAPSLLIVDMFWAPVRHLLPRLPCPAWLLVRACPPVWLTGRGNVRFDPKAWDRIIEIEPLGLPSCTHRIDPIVVVDPEECEPAPALHERLGVSPGARLTVLCHAGRPGEIDVLRAHAREHAGRDQTVVELDLHRGGPFPAARWLGAAEHVVAGAGYNTFWESRWLGYADRARLVAFERSIDRQQLRLDVLADHRPRQNGANVLAQWIMATV